MILLNKMTDIMQGTHGLDNENSSVQYMRSLNAGQRKRQFAKITAENQAILRRIQARQPVYSHLKVQVNYIIDNSNGQ